MAVWHARARIAGETHKPSRMARVVARLLFFRPKPLTVNFNDLVDSRVVAEGAPGHAGEEEVREEEGEWEDDESTLEPETAVVAADESREEGEEEVTLPAVAPAVVAAPQAPETCSVPVEITAGAPASSDDLADPLGAPAVHKRRSVQDIAATFNRA